MSWYRLLDSIAVGHRSLLEMLAVLRLINVIDEGAVEVTDPLEEFCSIGLAFFPVRKNKNKMNRCTSFGGTLKFYLFCTQVSSIMFFSCDSWSFFSRSYSCLSLFLNSTLTLVLFACIFGFYYLNSTEIVASLCLFTERTQREELQHVANSSLLFRIFFRGSAPSCNAIFYVFWEPFRIFKILSISLFALNLRCSNSVDLLQHVQEIIETFLNSSV